MSVKSLLKPADKSRLNALGAKELYASNLYKYMATCAQRKAYFGIQSFFLHESEDELSHWKILADFFNDRGDEMDMPEVPAIDLDSEDVKSLFQVAYNTEAELEEMYHEAYTSTKDVAIQQFLLQFIEIQRKAIGEYGDLLALIENCGSDNAAMLIFDERVKK